MDRRLSVSVRMFAFVFVSIFLAGAATAFAQGQGNGIFTGMIADNDGVVPGAEVTATDPGTGLVRTATSNEQGVFRLLSLPPGRYSLRVQMQGFKQITLNDVLLLSGETRDLGKLMLEVGILSEAVTVTAGGDPRTNYGQPASENRYGRPAHDDPGERARHLRDDENPAGRRRYDRQPRLRSVEFGPRSEY
jgi:carboxypeptidase family protein